MEAGQALIIKREMVAIRVYVYGVKSKTKYQELVDFAFASLKGQFDDTMYSLDSEPSVDKLADQTAKVTFWLSRPLD